MEMRCNLLRKLISKWHFNFFSKQAARVFFVGMLFCVPAFAAFSPRGIPDSSAIREKLIETWFEAPLEEVRLNASERHTAKDGNVFEVRMEENEKVSAIIVAPQNFITVNVFSGFENRSETEEVFAADAPGSWVLLRDKATGKPISIRYYFAFDSDVFVQINPSGQNTSNIDFMIYNMYAARNIPLRLKFSRFYSTSLSTLFEWTERTLPWNYADIYVGIYHSVQQMIGMIRQSLPQLKYRHDAMLDEREKPVTISTGAEYFDYSEKTEDEEEKIDWRNINRFAPVATQQIFGSAWTNLAADENKIKLSSGGFAKWICDGLVMPIAGGGLLRNPLIVQTVSSRATSYQGVLSQIYNLSFSLDWTRNLASAVRAVESGRELRYPASGVDVIIEPFNAEVTPEGISRVTGYIPNAGYSVRQLRSLLFVLAVTDPGKWYLGALRETDSSVSPEVHVFNECVAFFPYFDNDGKFRCSVFANCEELSLDKFVERFKNEFVHLTRVNSSDFFFPTQMNQN